MASPQIGMVGGVLKWRGRRDEVRDGVLLGEDSMIQSEEGVHKQNLKTATKDKTML